ncbi:MAG: hypothetical protein Q4C64_04230 [Erysipelotrichia bacterium]|nr:hypothetical protein [Erysipelotrichia bacterium]
MSEKNFKTILLLGLPASGKSEIREFINNNSKQNITSLHIGENVQLDDFPYVHFFSCIDEELIKLKQNRLFYTAQDPFIDDRDWGTLVNLLNQDYYDLVNKTKIETANPVAYIFDRIDEASITVGIRPRLSLLPTVILNKLYVNLKAEAEKLVLLKNNQLGIDLDNKTIVIEMSRGGKDGASFPLTGAKGYQYSLKQLNPKILSDAVILYVWVTPEESRRKNADRCDPNDPGSNLHHGVSLNVLLNDYGCDDLIYLTEISDVKDTVKVSSWGNDYYLPTGIFDNRQDKTSFLRNDYRDWKKEDIDYVVNGLSKATDTMYKTNAEREIKQSAK